MNFENIKIIFFDLDNTLFDHTRAQQNALKILWQRSPEFPAHLSVKELTLVYNKNNNTLWQQMAEGNISPQELRIRRFQMTFNDLKIHSENAKEVSDRYLEIYTNQHFVLPNVYETLRYLKPRYELGILSNGFASVQENKMANLRLNSFFKYEIYSEEAGALKPSSKIFLHAMRVAKAYANEIVYVGDSYQEDIIGAKQAGWKAILYNPLNKPTNSGLADAEISDLLELKKIF